jgi:muramoyltetrapeptide carboxypeptidase
MITLRHLRPGDTVAVIAPAGPCRNAERLAHVEPFFARHGLHARLYPSCSATHPLHDYLSGSDEQRLTDVHAALADDSIAAIFALRGGYGCARWVDRIDTALLRAHPKPLVGYSDVTTLHALWSREGLPSFHAPMPDSDWLADGGSDDAQALMALLMQPLEGGALFGPVPAEAWRAAGEAEGVLVGGNLTVVGSLIGTPYAVPVQGNLFLLEDIGEAPYRIDRLLTQLRLAGVLDAAAGFVVGSFTGNEGDATAVLQEHLLFTRKPMLSGWPAGHGQPNRTLPLGVRMHLDATAGTLLLLDPVLA